MMRIRKVLMAIGGLLPQKLQMFFYRSAGMTVGSKVVIRKGFYSDMPNMISIGNNSLLNCFCRVYFGVNNHATVNIGNNVFIGPNVTILCVTHEIGDEKQRAGKSIHKSVVIEDGVWIDANATILPGVTISRGSVIGANSVVLKSTSPNCLYVGIPASKKRDLSTI